MHISIEGIDGVGKSTTAKAVANALGFLFIEKPLHYIFDSDGATENYIRIRDYFNRQPDRFLSAWFYGLGSLYIRERFKGQDIVTDRHLLSNYVWSGTNNNTDIYDLLVKEIGTPDYTFILYADAKTVALRIRNRDTTDMDIYKTVFIPSAYKKMEEFCKRYNMLYMLIDTSSQTVEQVSAQIIQIVNGIKQC